MQPMIAFALQRSPPFIITLVLYNPLKRDYVTYIKITFYSEKI